MKAWVINDRYRALLDYGFDGTLPAIEITALNLVDAVTKKQSDVKGKK